MRRLDLRRLSADESGAVLVLMAFLLPVLILFASFVIDTANWWVHKRHLQTQADAAALAGAGAFRFPCSDSAIETLARQYSGDEGGYNQQVGGTPADRIHMQPTNSATFFGQSFTDPDITDGESPCAKSRVDVKMTETDVPWFFRVANVDFINAHARVAIRQIDTLRGLLPVGVEDVNPRRVRVSFVDESAGGAEIASQELTRRITANGVSRWDNEGEPVSITIPSRRVGMRFILSGTDSLTCGDQQVVCVGADAGSAQPFFIRGYSTDAGPAAGKPPIARDVEFKAGTCGLSGGNPSFHQEDLPCTVGLRASVDFPPTSATVVDRVIAAIGKTDVPLTRNLETGEWETLDATLPILADAGAVPVTLKWSRKGETTIGDQSCAKGQGCTGTFEGGLAVQRSYAANDASEPIRGIELLENDVAPGTSFAIGSRHDLVVSLGITGSIGLSEPDDPPIPLRVTGSGSNGQTLDCEEGVQFPDELADGCRPPYRLNTGETCPATKAELWASQPAWPCVATQPGGPPNQLAEGLNRRVLGQSKPTSCPHPDRYAEPYKQGDPRIVPVFIVPFGSFSAQGREVLPVLDFGFFYLRGWVGSGDGFENPCGDPPPEKGFVLGNFIKQIVPNTGGSGTQPCDLTSLGGCVAVMER